MDETLLSAVFSLGMYVTLPFVGIYIILPLTLMGISCCRDNFFRQEKGEEKKKQEARDIVTQIQNRCNNFVEKLPLDDKEEIKETIDEIFNHPKLSEVFQETTLDGLLTKAVETSKEVFTPEEQQYIQDKLSSIFTLSRVKG